MSRKVAYPGTEALLSTALGGVPGTTPKSWGFRSAGASVATCALSLFDSETYPRRAVRWIGVAATLDKADVPRKEAEGRDAIQHKRPACLNADDEMLAMAARMRMQRKLLAVRWDYWRLRSAVAHPDRFSEC